MLERFYAVARCITSEQQIEQNVRPVELLVIKPKIKFDHMAQDFTYELPQSMRFLLSMIGANKRGGGSSLANYILFEQKYCQALIQSGYKDRCRKRVILQTAAMKARIHFTFAVSPSPPSLRL
jgi:NTE family protein